MHHQIIMGIDQQRDPDFRLLFNISFTNGVRIQFRSTKMTPFSTNVWEYKYKNNSFR